MRNVAWIFGLKKKDLIEVNYLDVKLLVDAAKAYRDAAKDEIKAIRDAKQELAHCRDMRQRYYLSLVYKSKCKRVRITLTTYRLIQRDSLAGQRAFLEQCRNARPHYATKEKAA